MMIVRCETLSGVGMYHANGGINEDAHCLMYSATTPYDDKRLLKPLDGCVDRAYRFAWHTMEQFIAYWRGKHKLVFDELARVNDCLYLRIFDVPDEHVLMGDTQVMFKHEHATAVHAIHLTELTEDTFEHVFSVANSGNLNLLGENYVARKTFEGIPECTWQTRQQTD